MSSCWRDNKGWTLCNHPCTSINSSVLETSKQKNLEGIHHAEVEFFNNR